MIIYILISAGVIGWLTADIWRATIKAKSMGDRVTKNQVKD